MPQPPFCHRGHLKEEMNNGRMSCRPCLREENKKSRKALRERYGFPARSLPGTCIDVPGSFCLKGHQRIRESNGRIICKVCQNTRLRAQAAYRSKRLCGHVDGARGRLILSNDASVVCLDCLVEEANSAGL